MSPMILFGSAGLSELIPQVVTIILGFFITLWVLLALAWRPILKVIDERRETIAREFDDIDKKQEVLASQMKDYEARLRDIDQEARERTNKAIEEGRKSANQILDQARLDAEVIKSKSQSDIQMEIEKARVSLRDEMVALTISATETLLKAELNDDHHRQLVSGFITELENRKAS
jgi:F-type H+-transporting ATPase subunit b